MTNTLIVVVRLAVLMTDVIMVMTSLTRSGKELVCILRS